MSAKDMKGRNVIAGDRVRVRSVDQALLSSLHDEELHLVQSMIGNIFEVIEIDRYGYAIVEKQINLSDGRMLSQTMSLSSSEMELMNHAD